MTLRPLTSDELFDEQFDDPDVKWSLDLEDAEQLMICFMVDGRPWVDGWGSSADEQDRVKLAKACLSKV